MTPDAAALDELDGSLAETSPAEVALPTVRVLARLNSTAPDERSALDEIRERLAPVGGLYDDVHVERQEDDGSFWVVADFVTVSVDAHTAVLGVHQTLADAAVPVDEVWAEGA